MGKRSTLLRFAIVSATVLAFGNATYAQDKKAATPPPAPAKTAKQASPCKRLDEAACKAKDAECQWIAPKKGKQKPYCKLKATKKAAPAKKDAAPK
jgi:hypothetical protein